MRKKQECSHSLSYFSVIMSDVSRVYTIRCNQVEISIVIINTILYIIYFCLSEHEQHSACIASSDNRSMLYTS